MSTLVRDVLRQLGGALAEGDEPDRKLVAYAVGLSLDPVSEAKDLLERLSGDTSPGVRDTVNIARAAATRWTAGGRRERSSPGWPAWSPTPSFAAI